MTSSDIRIREAEPVDFTDVAEMHYPVWRRSWTGILAAPVLDLLGPPKRWVAEVYPQSLDRLGWSMWIAKSGGQTLGVTIFGPDSEDPDSLQIDALYIAEASQRL
ncbi:MAG TPA: N-acetyltransferase, partial [Mycobacterium sp.]|nr:N-acetyltransferase [Mycobacterium sp.]